MKISEKDRKIFLSLHMGVNRTVPDIARDTGYREQSVRYAISSMMERRLFQTELVVDEARLGLHQYQMFCNLSPNNLVTIEQLEQVLIREPIIASVTRVTGSYRHCISFYVKDYSEIEIFLDRLTSRFGSIISCKQIAKLMGWSYFGKKYLLKKWKPQCVLKTGFFFENLSLDEIDTRVINLLSKSPMTPISEVGRALRLPSATAAFRVDRLRKSGVLGYPLHRMDLSVAGAHAYYLLIRSRFPSKKFAADLVRYAAADPNIVEFFHVVGGWDHELLVEAEDPADIRRITQQLEDIFPDYLESVSQIGRLEDIKWTADFQPILMAA